MKEISKEKRLEVANNYILGYTYDRIEEETRVIHGSIANYVSEIGHSKLTISGIAYDRVNGFRQLSFNLKKGLEPSQARLGVSFFERLLKLGISPESLTMWSALARTFVPAGFPSEDLFESAIMLYRLEKDRGESFYESANHYIRFSEGTEQVCVREKASVVR